MGKLYIAANYVSSSEPGILVPNSLENSGHLQVVFENDSGQFSEIEVQRPVDGGAFGGNWNFVKNANHGVADDANDYVGIDGKETNASRYQRVELNLNEAKLDLDGTRTADEVWEMLLGIHNSLEQNGSGLDYDVPSQNSNSYVTSILYSVGIDVSDYLSQVTPADVMRFPGADSNVLLFGDNGLFDYSNGVAITAIGTAGNDYASGGNNSDILSGDAKNDILIGGAGDDTLNGGADDDTLDGGEGSDTAVYTGDEADYTVSNITTGTFTITDTRQSGGDGTDVVKNIEFLKFADKLVVLDPNGLVYAEQGQSVVLAIDVSGSMSDDLAAVKQSALQLVDSLFGTSSNPIASRLAIITFNDVGALRTELVFTDHAGIADRKAAALQAIESLSILGGGDEPLNGAVLSALTGGAGIWAAGMTANRVIVFSDEPAADPELRPQVISAAQNLRIGVEQDSLNGTVLSAVADTPFAFFSEALAAEVFGTAEVFGVVVGGDRSALSDLADLASQTGGDVVQAATADDVVEALLQVISTQIDFIGTSGNDTIDANANDNNIQGFQGHDVIFGNGGDDVISGGDGNDFIIGGNGNDTITGGSGNDQIFAGSSDVGNDTISGGEGDDVIGGGGGNDNLSGDNGDDVLFGGDGNDEINGAAGNDLAWAGSGADEVYGGIGNDTLGGGDDDDTIYAGNGNDIIYGGQGVGSDEVYGGAGSDTVFVGNGDDTVRGGNGADTLFNGGGSDEIFGGSGNDLIYGGGGNDALSGDGGADTFAFVGGNGEDSILDFTIGTDKIDVTGTFINFNSLADISANAQETSGNTIIDTGFGDQITLIGVSQSSLTSADFMF